MYVTLSLLLGRERANIKTATPIPSGKESNGSVDDEKMRSGHWFGSVLWVSFTAFTMLTQRASNPYKYLCHLSLKDLFGNMWRKKNQWGTGWLRFICSTAVEPGVGRIFFTVQMPLHWRSMVPLWRHALSKFYVIVMSLSETDIGRWMWHRVLQQQTAMQCGVLQQTKLKHVLL